MAISLITESTAFGDPDPKADAYYNQALEYLGGSGTAKEMIKELEGCNYNIFVLVQKESYSMFLHREVAIQNGLDGSLIVWDPEATVTAFNKDAATMQSPAIGLAHEMGHAVQWVKNRGWYLAYVNRVLQTSDQKAKLLIENDNITTYETPVASELGEGTRKDYNTSSNFREASKNYRCPYRLLPLIK